MPKHLYVVQRPHEESARKGHVLYTPAKPVTVFDKTLKEKVEDMIATMHQEQGIGIAAPQVGLNEAIFVIEASLDSSRYPHLKKYPQLRDVGLQVFINPRITEASPETIAYWHGCLSAKDQNRGLVKTYKSLSFTAQDVEGRTFTGNLEFLAAIIFQHEFRHLLGTLYVDHAKEFMSISILQEKIKSGEIELYSENSENNIPHLLSDYKVGESIEDYAKRLH